MDVLETMLLAEPMTATRHPLYETMTALQDAGKEFRKHFLTAPDDAAGWLEVTALTADDTSHLQNVFARVVEHFPTTDKRAPAALWFGQYAFAVQAVAIACYLAARRVPDLSPCDVSVRFEPNGEPEAFAWNSPRFIALPTDPDAADLDCRVVDSQDALRVVLREQIIQHLTPMVEAISLRSPFGKPGMWALAADYCASAFTYVAGVLGDRAAGDRAASDRAAGDRTASDGAACDEAAGAAEARLFAAPSSKLLLKRDFIIVEQSGLSYHLLDRTACCLYYKCDNGTYCSSCPHRPREERVELIKNWLEKRAAGAAQ